jgi:hypothetical protein
MKTKPSTLSASAKAPTAASVAKTPKAAQLSNLKLVIPTHHRTHKQITLGALPDALRASVTLVTSLPDEAKELRQLYPNNEVVTAKGTAHVAQKRHWIMANLGATGQMIFMMDDDLAFFQRCPARWRVWQEERGAYAVKPDAPAGTTLITRRYPSDPSLLALFQQLDARFDVYNPAMLCIAHRRHNDKQKEAWSVNGRMMHAFGVDPLRYKKLKIRFDAVQCREDFHVVLAMLRAGEQGHAFNELLYEAYGAFSAKGGCHEERSMDTSNAECDRLARLHPGFVKVVDRAYKGSINRKEVVVAWKRAYESSKV